MVVNEIAKARYMSDGQVSMPLVIRTANGGGMRFGAQHSQSVENWAMVIPGLKVVAPSTPADMKGLLAAAIRDDDPVIVFEHKALYAVKGEVPDGEHVVPLGEAAVVREGGDATIVALAAMVPRRARGRRDSCGRTGSTSRSSTCAASCRWTSQTIADSVAQDRLAVHGRGEPAALRLGRRDRLDRRRGGVLSLDAPIVRITAPHIPLPSAANLEELAIPTVDRIVDTVERRLDEAR